MPRSVVGVVLGAASRAAVVFSADLMAALPPVEAGGRASHWFQRRCL